MSFDEPCKTCGARIDGVDIAGGFVGDHCYCVPCMIRQLEGYKSFHDDVLPSLNKMQGMKLDEGPSWLISERAIKTSNRLRRDLEKAQELQYDH